MTTRLRRLAAALSTLLLVSAVFVVGAESFDEPAYASGASGGTFQVGLYATGSSTGGFFKRGYVFEVTEATVVTGLSGAGTSGGTFSVGLYQLESFGDYSSSGGAVCEEHSDDKVTLDGRSGNNSIIETPAGTSSSKVMVRHLLGSIQFSGSEADGKVVSKSLGTPVTLYPECSYLLAQMLTSGSGSHATVTGLDVVPLLDHPRIARWGPPATSQPGAPAGGVFGGVYRWSSASSATTFLDKRPQDVNNLYPNLGLRFESDYSLPTVRTETVSVEGSTVTFRGTVLSSGELEGTHPALQLAFEWGTSEDVGESGTFDVAGSTPLGSDNPAGTQFSFEAGSLTVGQTYYYRALAINEAGRAEGQLRSFTYSTNPVVQELALVSAGAGTASASADLVFGGTSDVSAHGFCFGTTTNPVFEGEDTCVNLGAASGLGPFSADINWSIPDTTAKVRAFAKNTTGTSYSDEVEITKPTNSSLPTLVGGAFSTGSAVAGTEGTWNDGGLSITQTSYQWRATLSGDTIDIPGATSLELPCLPPTPGIVGSALTLAVTKTNLIGSTTVTSSSSGVVADGGPCTSPPPPPPPPATAPAPPRPTAAPVPPPVVQAPVTVPGRTTPVAPAPPPAPVTGPVLRGNVVPTAPQQPVARVGTRDIPVATQVNTPNRLDVRASSVSLGVSVPQTVGGVRQQAGGPTELEVRSGGQTTLQGGGVLARSTVQVFMPLQGDNAKQIAQIEADATGTFNGDAVFATQRTEPPLPVGPQVLQIVSLDDTGQQVVMEMAVVIAQPPPAPEFDRSVDALPTLPPGQSIATEAGLPVQVAVRGETENRQAVIEADDWSMAIAVAGQEASVEETPEGGASLTFVRDETASVQGSGFMPGTRADVWLFSEPTLLGTVTIDDNGEFNGEISVDGRIVTIGEHTLQLQGVGFDGYVRSANLGVVVKDADAEVATTADVAASFAWWFWIIGLFALLLVAIIAYWLYRRARQEAA